MSQPLLNGNVDTRDQEIYSLKFENNELREKIGRMEFEVKQIQRATSELRRLTSPFLNFLLAIHGQMEIIGGDVDQSSPSSSKWDAVKQRVPPRHRECIDLLLVQGKMNRKQIAAALKMNYTNCATNVIAVLIRQGWLIDGHDGISLKQL